MSTPASGAPPVWVIEPNAPGVVGEAREVWNHRRFMKFLATRAFRKTYARTFLGWGWLFIRPLFPIALRVLIFGALTQGMTFGVPYFVFMLLGSLPWGFFASALMWSTRGLEMNRSVLSRIYIPKVILPLSTMAPAVLDLILTTVAVAIALVFYWLRDGTPYVFVGIHTLWAVAAMIFITLLATGIGLFTSVWGETARDARFTLGQTLTIWFLLTPVLYPLSEVPVKYRGWMRLNPMAAFVEAFKYGTLGIGSPDPAGFALAAAMSLGIVFWGLLFFARRDQVDGEDE